MWRLVAVCAVAFLAGCSNAPIAGFMDTVFPAKAPAPRQPDRPISNPVPSDVLPPPVVSIPNGSLIGPPTAPPASNPNVRP